MKRRHLLALGTLRGAIDLADDGLIVLLAARARLVRGVAELKRRGGCVALDAAREARVQARRRSRGASRYPRRPRAACSNSRSATRGARRVWRLIWIKVRGLRPCA